MNKTEQLKSECKFFEAGANAFANKEGRTYGCHYGMRSTRWDDMTQFYKGYDEAEETARELYKEKMENH